MNARFFGLIAASALAGGAASAEGELKLADLEHAIARGEYPKTTSVLIIRNGNLAYEGYFGEGSQEALNNTRSATKFLTTLALGAAIGDRTIASEQVPAFAYLSDLKPFQNDSPLKSAMLVIRRALSRSPLITGSSTVAVAEKFGAVNREDVRVCS